MCVSVSTLTMSQSRLRGVARKKRERRKEGRKEGRQENERRAKRASSLVIFCLGSSDIGRHGQGFAGVTPDKDDAHSPPKTSLRQIDDT